MANKAAIVILGLGAAVAGTLFFATRAKAAPEEPEIPGLPEWYRELIPTPDDILASKTMGDLEVYYMYIGQLYFTGQIDRTTYESLYQSYVTRFYQLTGWQQ